jgi:hypothetical protein
LKPWSMLEDSATRLDISRQRRWRRSARRPSASCVSNSMQDNCMRHYLRECRGRCTLVQLTTFADCACSKVDERRSYLWAG